MTRRVSIRLRLTAYAALMTIAALAASGYGLTELFSRHLERRIGQELDTHLSQLAGGLRFDASGNASLAREPADPRFLRVFGGLYWQIIDQTSGQLLRSRSLFDGELSLPEDRLEPGIVHSHSIPGPGGSSLIVHEQLILVPAGGSDHELRVSVAVDRIELQQLEAGFSRDLLPALGLLGTVLVLGFAFQIGPGLRPLDRVRSAVASVRAGRSARLENDVPAELSPMVEEINLLIDLKEKDMVRARDRAADLAHGLKTPLTALASDIRRLREAGETAIAGDIEELADRMRRHMERELVRARIRHGNDSQSSNVASAADAIIRTVQRTANGGRLGFRNEAATDHEVAVDLDDLHEMLGNLVENAARHATGEVLVRSQVSGTRIAVSVEDDGPGIGDAHAGQLSLRGKRLDQSGTGTGLGLAIVEDILSACDGSLELGRSDLGGLKAQLLLPAAPAGS